MAKGIVLVSGFGNIIGALLLSLATKILLLLLNPNLLLPFLFIE